MKLLLISNSTNAGEEYLDYPKYDIKKFLGETPVEALFIPYAAVTFSFDDYEKKVIKASPALEISISFSLTCDWRARSFTS